MNTHEVAEQFEELVEQNKIVFKPAKKADLQCSVADEVVKALEEARLVWELGDIKIGKNFIIKTNSGYIHYVDIFPETGQFAFCGEGHHEGIRPSEGFLWLAFLAEPDSSNKKKQEIIDLHCAMWPGDEEHLRSLWWAKVESGRGPN